MPIYDYQCAECGAEFEQLVRGTATKIACPRCSATKVERRMSLTARPAGGTRGPDLSRLGPPPGGCCGGACGSHSH